MSIDQRDMDDGILDDASHLLARGAADDVRADRRIMAAIDDFLLNDDARLDDRLRSRLGETLTAVIGAIEAEVRQHAARLIGGRDQPGLASALVSGPMIVYDALGKARLLGDRDILRELLGRVAQERLSETLPGAGPDVAERPSLLVRLAAHPDGVIAGAATAALVADARRRSTGEPDIPQRSDLPAELHHRLVWRAAAVLRHHFVSLAEAGTGSVDRALTEAALRSLSAHDEGERLEATSMRLAAALDATGAELAAILTESIDDRRPSMFIALLAHALGLDYDAMREIVLDPVSDRLWLVLRAVALGRTAIARIGLALCDADPRRNVEKFADMLDTIVAVAPDAASAALATFRLHPDFRRAVLALAQTGDK